MPDGGVNALSGLQNSAILVGPVSVAPPGKQVAQNKPLVGPVSVSATGQTGDPKQVSKPACLNQYRVTVRC